MLFEFGAVDVAKLDGLGYHLLAGCIQVEIFFIDIVHALETLADIDRPTEWTHGYFEFGLYLIEQVERVLTFTVELVDKDNNGGLAHAAHLHQLTSLCLNTFCRINYNNYAIYGSQCAIGILGKILVTGGVENIDFVIAVIKTHHRRGYRYTALFLDFHPVRGGGLLYLVGLHGSCHVNGAAKQQQFLGKSGLTGIGVTDNGKGASFLNLFGKCTHVVSGVLIFILQYGDAFLQALFPVGYLHTVGSFYLFLVHHAVKGACGGPRDSRRCRWGDTRQVSCRPCGVR